MSYNFSEVIRDSIVTHINQIHTGFPARITEVGDESLTVQPLIRVKNGNQWRIMPVIYAVPYLSSVYGNRGIIITPQVGDDVWVQCAEVNLDEFLISGEECNSNDGRKFSLNDAVAICGFNTASKIINNSSKYPVTVRNGDNFIGISDDGKVNVNNAETHAVVYESLIKELTQLILDLKVSVPSFVTTANFTTCKSEDLEIK